ncbi:hypothetical protein LTR47_009210 [Exophiala xenobiotica]|nr:hypothetical protein LTR41_009900 [Exophiala xenobiotica]KAK5226320.1 hypothetical protein LTR47_009210 [Exophiala xenobiotica]KAK5250399.1 hypothetical protein LTS06_004830 [Exophiala xenobiotica]KAK5351334.1 hypothetical protein LTR61_004683 [Exophiala xenobiotica]KAK5383736.1 hypothetical protein LTR11_002746 [Exophiala xenobiotica]
MPRAEVGSTKYIANQMKSKGLQRLRWYCQACSRQMRDENGFKCHVASESHVRQMQLIGEDPKKAINDFSRQFLRDFVQLLRTGHGEKRVNVNHFYQEYISNKSHVHMNATKWPSLTEFAKYLGREGICRVDEDEKNEDRGGASALTISWIDNSPEALRRQDALRKKERQDRGDEEREQRMIQEQIRKAKREGRGATAEEEGEDSEDLEGTEGEGFKRKDGEKIVLSFGAKKSSPEAAQPPTPPLSDKDETSSDKDKATSPASPSESTPAEPATAASSDPVDSGSKISEKKQPFSMSFGASTAKPKNVFAAASKKKPLVGASKTAGLTPSRPMSEAERIMKEEIERKRQREAHGFKPGQNAFKKQRIS